MQPSKAEPEILQRILAEELPPEQEKAAVESWVRKNPAAAAPLLLVCLGQKHQYKAALEELRARLRRSPWHPATFLQFLFDSTEQALVAAGSRRLSVALAPEIDPAQLRRGAVVFLNSDMNLLLRTAPQMTHAGAVAEFSRFHDGRAVLRVGAGEELVVDLAEPVREAAPARGDLLLYDRDSLVAIEKVEARPSESELLVTLPADIGIEQLGGLDGPFGEIAAEIRLHLFHRELVEAYRLGPVKGVLLCGPPGVGKTSLVKCLARGLSTEHGVQAAVLLARPGIHRSMWYGASEQNVRSLFEEARRAAACGAYVLLFFDDVDQLGARENYSANAVDSRILPCFLQEIDALRSESRILLVGATNRQDLLDEALLRPGRFGDKIFRIPRPGRAAAREIFRKYLTPDLPYAANGHPPAEAAAGVVEDALAAIFSAGSEYHALATLAFRDGSRKPLTAPQVMSGALIESVVTQAKLRGCFRALAGGPPGISSQDLLAAIARELTSLARRLKPGPALHQMLELSTELDVVRVEPRRDPGSHEYLRMNDV